MENASPAAKKQELESKLMIQSQTGRSKILDYYESLLFYQQTFILQGVADKWHERLLQMANTFAMTKLKQMASLRHDKL